MLARTAWESFQSGEDHVEVRAEILTSWRRSQLSGVDPAQVGLPHAETDTDTRFARVAVPVVGGMAGLLTGSDTCLAVTDATGRVLWRWVSDAGLRRNLDALDLVEGFSFDEEHAGTNGVGTALETRRVITVCGDEHFKEPFHGYTCVAAPVVHPLNRRVLGAVNLTCRSRDTNDRLEPAVRTLVREVRAGLLQAAGARERSLFAEFLTARSASAAPVLSISPDVLIANAAAAGIEVDHAALWDRVLDVVDDGGPVLGPVVLPGTEGRTAQVRTVIEGARLAGAVLVVDPAPGTALPAGRATTWDRVVGEVSDLLAAGSPVLLRGEPGTGKRHLLAGLLPAATVHDAADVARLGLADWSRSVATSTGPLVLLHLDQLTGSGVRTLAAQLATRPGRPALAGTCTTDDGLTPLVDRLDAVPVDLPPLRVRRDELPALVAELAGPVTRRAGEALARHAWPGNTAQLRVVLRQAVRAAGGRPVDLDALPAELTATGRRLTLLEQAESRVIEEVLAAHGGNKTAAARELGVSRPTLYAKLRAYRR